MKWLDLIKELDDVRSKIRSEHHVMDEVNWTEPYIENLLFVLQEHNVTPRVVPVVEEQEAPTGRVVKMAGREIRVKSEPGEKMRAVPVPRQPDKTVNKAVSLKATDEAGKELVDQPPLGEGAVWVPGDS